MKVTSHSFTNGQPIPVEFALGTPEGFGRNRNPHLAWEDVPQGTRSLVLLCVDTDAPADASLAGKAGVEIPVDAQRADFVHWVLVDIAPDVHDIAAGSVSDGFEKAGKKRPHGPRGSRQGLNDYTGWFAGDPDLAGDYQGYDGPYPPPNDLLKHRYFFRVFALDVDQLELPQRFTAADVMRAMHGHVLAESAIHGTYWLHPAPRG